MSSTQELVKLSRRKALGLLATGLGTLAAASCVPSAPSTPATTSSASNASTTPAAAAAGAPPQPESGGTLRYGTDVDVNRLDPHFRLADVYYTVYDRLTQYDINHNVQPMLAESWDISTDFTSIKFNLRKGVQFHNGAELDSAAVKFNSERARDLPNTQLEEAKWWTSIETPDKYTVIFKSDKPRPLAFDYFEFLNIAEPTYGGRSDQSRRHGSVQIRRMEAERLAHADQKPQLLAVRQTVPGRHRDVGHHRSAGDGRPASRAAHSTWRINYPVSDFIRLRTDRRLHAISRSPPATSRAWG